MTATYAYRAMRGDGRIVNGRLSAQTQGEALAMLERDGLLAVDVRESAHRAARRSQVSTRDLSLGLRVLADLLEAGLPIARALHALTDVAPPGWLAILPHVQQSIREGRSLGAALADAPLLVSELVVGMLVAGEASGQLAAAVRRAADVTESAAEMRASIRAALAYPAILAITGAGAVSLMTGVVIPRFAAILSDLGETLPRSTQIVLAGADLARSGFRPALAIGVAIAIGWRMFTASANGRRRWHGMLLNVPLLGGVRRSSSTARFALTLASLLESAVPLRQAMRLAGAASGDAAVTDRVDAAAVRVDAGQSLARALEEAEAVSPLAQRLVHAGEESGRLPSMLRHAAKLEQQHSESITRAAVRLLEPMLILLFAGVVALVSAALLQAVYSIRPAA